MNLMRKLRGTGGASGEPVNAQHNALGLMHLRKLFAELQKPPQPLSEQEKNDKLYNLLPLFCKVRNTLLQHSSSSKLSFQLRFLVQFYSGSYTSSVFYYSFSSTYSYWMSPLKLFWTFGMETNVKDAQGKRLAIGDLRKINVSRTSRCLSRTGSK